MVFKEHGDYEHKQRNRMKFMIKKLGWDRFVAEYQKCARLVRGRGPGAAARHRPAGRGDRPPTWSRAEAPAPSLIVSRVSPRCSRSARASRRRSSRSSCSATTRTARWRATNVRPQKQFGYVIAIVTVPLGDLTSEQMRVIGELARAYSDGTVRVTVDQNLVFRWVQRRRPARAVSASGGGQPRPRRGGDRGRRGELPGRGIVPARRHAVARPRPAARGHPAARPDLDRRGGRRAASRSAAARTAAASTTSPTIGFQGSVRRIGGKAVPQYFVMVGRRHDRRRRELRADRGEDSGAPHPGSGRTPDRTSTQREKQAGESAPAFFQRIDIPPRRRRAERSAAADSRADAAPRTSSTSPRPAEFTPEVMDGECSA